MHFKHGRQQNVGRVFYFTWRLFKFKNAAGPRREGDGVGSQAAVNNPFMLKRVNWCSNWGIGGTLMIVKIGNLRRW